MKAVYGFLSCIVLMGLRAKGENNANVFLQDIITTFKLTSPTIVYNKEEEAPDICHSAKWVLCLHSGMSSWYPEPEDDAKKMIEDSTGDFSHTNNPHIKLLFRLSIFNIIYRVYKSYSHGLDS